MVIDSVQVQGVYLGSGFTSSDLAGTVSDVDAYLSYIVGSSLFDALNPYDVGTGTATPGVVIDDALPQSPNYLTDADIQNYLTENFANGVLMAPSESTVHVVYVEPGVAVAVDRRETSVNSFLGYHSQGVYDDGSGTTQTYAYAVIPYPGDPNPSPDSQGFDNVFDELTAITSHELVECVTDPDLTNGWQETVVMTVYWQFRSFKIKLFAFQLTGEEICDVTLLLFDYGSVCFARLDGYLIEKPISPDGVTPLVPDGATEVSSQTTTATATQTTNTTQGTNAIKSNPRKLTRRRDDVKRSQAAAKRTPEMAMHSESVKPTDTNPTSPLVAVSPCAARRGPGFFPLQFVARQGFGEPQVEFVQQDLLVVRRAGDAAAAEFRAGAGREHHIHQPHFAQTPTARGGVRGRGRLFGTGGRASSRAHTPGSRRECEPAPGPLSGARSAGCSGRFCECGTRLPLR